MPQDVLPTLPPSRWVYGEVKAAARSGDMTLSVRHLLRLPVCMPSHGPASVA